MKNRKIELKFKNIVFYLVGFIIIGLGVNFMNSADLGVGAWDTVTINGRYLLNTKFGLKWVTIGMVSALVSTIIMITVLIYRKNPVFFIMLIPIVIMGSVIDFWNIVVFDNYVETVMYIQVLFYFLGIIFIPLGLVFIVKSNFPAFVFEEWTFMMSEVTKKSFQTTRTFIEIFGLAIGSIFGFITFFGIDGTLGVVNLGSIVFAFTIGPTLHFLLKLMKVTEHETTLKEDFLKIGIEIERMAKVLKRELTWSRAVKYFLGMVSISLGVVMMLRSSLGNSSWDTLHFSLHSLTGITIGTATIAVALVFTALVIWLNKSYKYLIMAIPILIVGPLIDLFNDVILVDFEATTMLIRVLSLTSGLVLLPFGGALLLISTYPAGVFDEFNLAVMRKLNMKNLIPIRVIMELSAVTAAYVFGLMAGIGFGKIHIGTLIFSFTVGIFLKLYLKLFERIGLNENQQIN